MRLWTITFSLGVIICGFVPALPHPVYCYCLLASSLLLQFFSRWRLIAAFWLGCSLVLLYGRHSISELLPVTLETEDLWVEGTVWNLPQQTERSVRFEFMVEKLCAAAGAHACSLQTSQKRHQKILLNSYQESTFKPGQRWLLLVRLRRPHGFSNPGGFDYEAWLMQQRIRATGYIREHSENALLSDDAGQRIFNRWRYELTRKLALTSAGRIRHESLLRALTIGDGHGISEAEWELFSQTGTNHLMVISGSHVALIALVIYRLGWFLYTRWHGYLFLLPAPTLAAVTAIGGAFIYTGLAGFSLPAIRALVMVALYLGGVLLRRQTHPINALCLALALILAADPLAAQNAGFWLSFGAVAILLFSMDGKDRSDSVLSESRSWGARLHDILKTQFFIFTGLLPVMLVYFHQISLTAPLVNILAIPFIGFVVVPLSLIAMMTLSIWPAATFGLLLVIDYLLEGYLVFLTRLTELVPIDVLKLPAQSYVAMLIILVLVWLVQFSTRFRHKAFALMLLPAVLFWPKSKLAPGELKIAVLDVGQGLAVVAATRDHALLYDAGPAFSKRFDAGSDVVVPYLQNSNISKLDIVIISHADADHAGGLAGIAENFPDAYYMGSDTSIFSAGLRNGTCTAGTSWNWDNVSFELIHPDAFGYGKNNGSCVLKITAGTKTILLPGDIEKPVEARLVSIADLHANILVAPHHGSRTSSTPSFIADVKPEFVVFSSGFLNRFGHPAPDVVERYEKASSRTLTTSETGALTFTVSPKGEIQFTGHRRERPRFWSAPP